MLTLKRAVSLLLALTLSPRILGSGGNEKDMYSSSFHFSFSPAIYQGLSIKHRGVGQYLKSYPLPSGECSIGYGLHIENGYFINADLGFGVIPVSAGFNFSGPVTPAGFEEENNHTMLCFDYIQLITTYTISFQKLVISRKSEDYTHSFETGVKLNRLLIYPLSYEIGYNYFNEFQEIPFFSFQLDNDVSKNFISFFAKVGRKKKLKNGNFMQVSLVGNFSPKTIGKGSYRFENLQHESYGDVYQTINYVGVEFKLNFKPSKILNYI